MEQVRQSQNLNLSEVPAARAQVAPAKPTALAADLTDIEGRVTALEGASSGLAFTTVEVNLGTTARRSGRFTIAGTGMTVGKPVLIQQAPGPYTGKGTRADEAEMDGLMVTASVTSGTAITAYWSSPRRVRGNFKFIYAIGA